MPQELPHGVSAEGVGLRSAALFAGGAPMAMSIAPAPAPMRAMRFRAQQARGLPAGEAAAKDEESDREKGGGGALGRLAGELFGALKGKRKKQGKRERGLRGRIALRRGTTLMIQFEVEGAALDWKPGAEVELAWADGRSARAKVTQSTRPGSVPAGQQIRLVLDLAAHEPAPAQVIVDGAEYLIVTLEA
jgi:hypothetical protein